MENLTKPHSFLEKDVSQPINNLTKGSKPSFLEKKGGERFFYSDFPRFFPFPGRFLYWMNGFEIF
ncbi:MAG: hypothetical protein DRN54_03980 [Thaumarchaeota archaeon]|nr:MAG: hypothetical protein DRN54_03980 [Nitrososphaerota archaeon]